MGITYIKHFCVYFVDLCFLIGSVAMSHLLGILLTQNSSLILALYHSMYEQI